MQNACQWRRSNNVYVPIMYMYYKRIENVEHFKYLGEIITNSGNS